MVKLETSSVEDTLDPSGGRYPERSGVLERLAYGDLHQQPGDLFHNKLVVLLMSPAWGTGR